MSILIGLPNVTNALDLYPTAMTNHLGQLAAERTLCCVQLQPCQRQQYPLSTRSLRPRRHDHPVRGSGRQGGMNESRLRALDLTAVASTSLGIEEQVVFSGERGHVRFQRDQVGRVLHVAADWNRARDVTMDSPMVRRTGLSGGNNRRPAPVLVQYQQLDEVIGVTLVVDAYTTRPARVAARAGSMCREYARFCEESDRADVSARGKWSSGCVVRNSSGRPRFFRGQPVRSGRGCPRCIVPPLRAQAQPR